MQFESPGLAIGFSPSGQAGFQVKAAGTYELAFSLLAQTNNDYVFAVEVNQGQTPLTFGQATTNGITQIQGTALLSLNKSDVISLARGAHNLGSVHLISGGAGSVDSSIMIQRLGDQPVV